MLDCTYYLYKSLLERFPYVPGREVRRDAERLARARINPDHNMLDLLEFMREKLSNDSFQLRVELTDISNLPQILSPKEFLKKTVADNKVLGNLLSEIEAELT